MSIYVIREVMEHSEARHGARLVALALADAADKETGICWPSEQEIGRVARLSEKAVRDGLRWLEQNAEIETRQARFDANGRRSKVTYRNVYRVLVGLYSDVEVADADLPFTLLESYSRPADIAGRRDQLAAGLMDSQVPEETAAPPADSAACDGGDDRQISPGTTGRIRLARLNGSVRGTGTTRGSSDPLVPAAGAGEREAASHQSLVAALADGLQRSPATRSEHGLFGLAAAELAAAGATPEQVLKACARARRIWPGAVPTPTMLTRHWSLLHVPAKPAAAAAAVQEWVETAAPTLEDFSQVAAGIESMRSSLGKELADRLLAAAEANWQRQQGRDAA